MTRGPPDLNLKDKPELRRVEATQNDQWKTR